MTGRLLMDYGGAIEALALCNPDGTSNRALLRAHRNLLTQLPPDIAVSLVCRADRATDLRRWLGRIGHGHVGLIPATVTLRPDALWVQDHLVVRTEGRRRTYTSVVSEHPYDTARWLGAADGVAVERSRLHLSGGNLLVGADFRIVGAGAIEAEAGRPTPARWQRALGRHSAFDPRPLHVFGYGFSPGGPPLFQEPFHLDLALALTGCRTVRGQPVVLLASPARPMPELDDAAKRLRAGGFFVVRNPVPTSAGSIVGYNNVLVENVVRPGQRRPFVFIPQFGNARHDAGALLLWRKLGFSPRGVSGWAPFVFPGGALHCAAKILRRGPWRGPERVIADSTLGALERLAP